MTIRTVLARPALKVAGGILAAGALVGVGGFAGVALSDDDDPGDNTFRTSVPVATDSNNGSLGGPGANPFPGRGAPSFPAGESGADDGDAALGGGFAGSNRIGILPPYGYCGEGEIDGAISGATIDPAGVGFAMNLLGEGFSLQSIQLRAQAECDDQGNPTGEQIIFVDTSWIHAESEFAVYLSQRQSPEQTANILHDSYAEFWADGYAYSASVSGYAYPGPIIPLEDGPATDPAIARDAEAVARAEGEFDSAEARALLLEVVASVAPSVEEQCFYTQVPGDWSTLAALGLGDPRGAIPAGWTEEGLYGVSFAPPADGCDTPDDVQLPISFNANFTLANGEGWLGINVYQRGEYEGDYPGYLSEHNVSWSTGDLRFDIYAETRDGLGLDQLQAIAAALDPNFGQACLISESPFTPDQLAANGVNTPAAPGGYELGNSNINGSVRGSGCDDAGAVEHINAYWEFENDDGIRIQVSAWRDLRNEVPQDPYGFAGPNYIEWMADNGTSYSVSSWSDSRDDQGAPQELLEQIALSLDPGLDIDSLNDGGYPEPLPVDDLPGTSSSGSAESDIDE